MGRSTVTVSDEVKRYLDLRKAHSDENPSFDDILRDELSIEELEA